MILSAICFNLVRGDDSVAPLINKAKNTPISPEEIVKDMKEKLSLSDAQVEQVLPIIQQQAQDIKKIIADISSGQIDAGAATRMQDILAKTDDDLAQILTPEQMAKWQAIMAQGRQKAGRMIQDSGITGSN
jgi:hypothetical protein